MQLGEVVVVEGRDDQEDRVRAGDRRLVDLVGVDDEVLAEDRQHRGGARLTQVVERAAEVRPLGEDRQCRGAAALVGADDVGDGRAGADLARARRAALVLGDERDAGPVSASRNGRSSRGAASRALELGQRHRLAAAGEVLACGVDDAVEDAHRESSSATTVEQ